MFKQGGVGTGMEACGAEIVRDGTLCPSGAMLLVGSKKALIA